MIAFNNLHRIASRLIPTEKIKWRKALDSTTNEYGERVPTYGDWTETIGHVQPGIAGTFGSKNLSEKEYKDFGLDFSRRHITAWVNDADIGNSANQDSCDQLMHCGKVYNIVRASDWLSYDGWKLLIAEEEKP